MSIKKRLVEICHLVYSKGFVAAQDGNLSVKINDHRFLITRSGICKGEVTEEDILEIDNNGNVIEGKGKVSTEYKIHLFAYKNRKEINSVVHCHPSFATAFSVSGQTLTDNVFPEVILTIGKVPLCDYGTPSTEELPNSLKPYIEHAWAFLLKNHGAVTIGKTLDDAFFKMDKLEHTAKTLFISKLLGKVDRIPKDKVMELIKISKDTYGIQQDERNIF